jgi:hypothetical protein
MIGPKHRTSGPPLSFIDTILTVGAVLLVVLVILLGICVAKTYAQTITVGPTATLNKLAWSMADGDTTTIAQAFEVRVRVDGAVVPIVVPSASCITTALTDSSGAIWTLGSPATQVVLRNGIVTSGFGNTFSLVNGAIYVLGTDLNWWKWTGTTWVPIIASDPTPAVLLAAGVHRWTCQANLIQSLVVALNAIGPHTIVLRLYDAVAKTCGIPAIVCESVDSTPFSLTMPEIVTQPVLVRIIR